MLPKLYDGTHIHHPLASRRAVRRVEFNVPAPIDVMIDGEIANLEIHSLDIIPRPSKCTYEARLLALRSVVLWSLSIIHFFIARLFLSSSISFWTCAARLAAARLLPPHRLSFGRPRQNRSLTNFDPHRTSFFMVNHVNLFDPFILYCAIPQLVRGWELESHFKIPAYGWLMKRFGNVPVQMCADPQTSNACGASRKTHQPRTSLIIFPEAKRTRDGHINEFQDGGFRLAQQLGVPIVP